MLNIEVKNHVFLFELTTWPQIIQQFFSRQNSAESFFCMEQEMTVESRLIEK
jgi:hypothetical protein